MSAGWTSLPSIIVLTPAIEKQPIESPAIMLAVFGGANFSGIHPRIGHPDRLVQENLCHLFRAVRLKLSLWGPHTLVGRGDSGAMVTRDWLIFQG